MSKLIFKHIRDTNNIGDRSCCPLDYIYFDNSIAIDIDEKTPQCDAVVYGGGKIFGSLNAKMTSEDVSAKVRIAWGVSTVQKNPLSLRYALSRRRMNLIGTRDFNDKRFTFAPCVSCMSPLFDEKYEIKNEVVFYMHKEKTPKSFYSMPEKFSSINNYADSMREAIQFIGSGRTVVSNSYHGVYWALLLGRRVLCLPFSNKFFGFQISPGYSDLRNWRCDLNKAQSHNELLDLSRFSTRAFEVKVREIIDKVL